MIAHRRDGDVHVLTMNEGPNLVDPDFVARFHAALDEVEAESAGACALVITGEGKFFSNGLNLPVLMKLPKDEMRSFGQEMGRLLSRLLIAPIPTVAAVNGHAFAAGAVIALACDYRIMREDRGWICFSEVDAGVPIAPPMMALIRAKLPAATAREAVLAGKRFNADEAIAASFADAKAPEADLVGAACKMTADLAGKERGIFGALKKTLWGDVARGLRGED